MKPTPGILYQIGNKIVCAEREKPEKPKPHRSVHSPSNPFFLHHEVETYKSWLESCKDVVNGMEIKGIGYIQFNKTIDEFTSGQKCLFIPAGEKVRIVELK